MESGKYENAINAFNELDGYKDSATQIRECQYKKALVLMENGKYENAINAFNELDGYKDSATQIRECQYKKALVLMENGKYVEAYKVLVALDGYKDSADKADSIYGKYKIEIMKEAKVGDCVFFGTYEQDNDTSNGKEDIEWLVLKKEGTKVFVISKYALDCKQYNTSYTDVTWKTCSLRDWLNNDFINSAFSKDEQKMIPTVTVSADANPKYKTNPGNATQDKVFLLSINEVNKYFTTNESRMCIPTDYAIKQGAYTSVSHTKYGKGTCCWWLRSPGSYQDEAAYVDNDGGTDEGGDRVDYDYVSVAVRPALWIDLNA